MTFILTDRYPGRANSPTDEYPRGSFKNRTSPTTEDGTYLEEDWKNDERGFFEAIVLNAGITPNGNVDTGRASQLYDGLISLIEKKIASGAASLYGQATGASDAISVTLNRSIQLIDGVVIYVRARYANVTSAPTLTVDGTATKAIVKGNNVPLKIGDIAGAGYVMQLTFDTAFDRWIMLNPATGVVAPETIPRGTLAYMARTGPIPGWLFVDGTEHNRRDYAEFISECPQFITSGSSSETFKLIDLRGYFLRTLDSGKGVDTGRVFGSQQGDAIRNIKGEFIQAAHDAIHATGPFYNTGRLAGRCANKSDGRYVCAFDASRVVPVAGENRPKNYAFPIYVKI